MNVSLGMTSDEIAHEMEKWNAKGQLPGTFSISIGVDICRARDKEGKKVLGQVEDEVV